MPQPGLITNTLPQFLFLLSSYFCVSKKVIRQLSACGSSSSGGQEGERHGKNDKGLYLPI